MSDEGVHEIQLNGKQLVFMFMAVTVVAVVIFLCGVMVGRGVRAPRAIEQADATIETAIDPTAAITSPAPPPTSADASDAGAPVSPQGLTYSDRLSVPAPSDTLREQVATDKGPEIKAASVEKPRVSAPAPVAPAVRTSKPAAKASEGGYVVQVTAVKVRSEADAIARRLTSKGFPTFVTSPGEGAARVYRVRVGTYNDRREAESVARRLEKEEQFKPWITR